MVACAKLGLRVKYIGTVGDDERGRIQMESLPVRESTWIMCRSERTARTRPPTS